MTIYTPKTTDHKDQANPAPEVVTEPLVCVRLTARAWPWPGLAWTWSLVPVVGFGLGYNLSDGVGGGWSKMKVSFSVSSQSILKRFI